jgi:hypothetical protein
MRLGACLLLSVGGVLCASACSGGYPLAPTRCDEFCDATKGFQCEQFYQPAACVSQCEQNNTDAEACRVQFDAAVSCFRKTPAAVGKLCDFSFTSEGLLSRPCLTEQTALSGCNSGYFGPTISE